MEPSRVLGGVGIPMRVYTPGCAYDDAYEYVTSRDLKPFPRDDWTIVRQHAQSNRPQRAMWRA